MEDRYFKNFSRRQNSSVLPIILYLTLPTVTHHGSFKDIHNVRRTKSKKQQQRDPNRLNTFIERKSVCSELPFHSLDSAEIQTMSAEQISAKKPKIFSELTKLNKLKEENVHLNSSIIILEENIIKGNSI